MKHPTCLFILKLGLLFELILTCCCYRYPRFESLEWTRSHLVKEQKLFTLNLENQYILLNIKKSLIFLKDWNFNFLNVSNVGKRGIYLSNEMQSCFTLKLFVSSYAFDLNNKKLNRNLWHAYINKKTTIGNQFEKEAESTYNSMETIVSASIGVIRLYETYGANITEYSKGHLDLKTNIDRKSRVVDSLQIDDLAFMSYISMYHLMWYDTGLKYLKVAIDQLQSRTSERKFDCYKRVNEILLEMKRSYPSVHNDILNKMRYPIGPSWKCFPFMVNQGRRILYLSP